MRRYSQRTLINPRRTLLIWALLVALGGVSIAVLPQLKLNPTFSSMIMADDPDRADDRRAKEIFGSDELITIAVQNDNGVFNIPTLALIDQITERVQAVGGVRKIYSLTRIENIRGRDGELLVDDLITDLPKTDADLQRIEREAFENPTYVSNIVSRDKTVASINVELALDHNTSEGHERITHAIYEIVEELEKTKPADTTIHVTGYPVGSYVGGIYMLQDMVMFGAGTFLMLSIVMWLVFRCWQGVVATMFVVMCANAVTYGLMSAAGVPVTMPLSAVMVFLTALGMQYSTYIGFAYRERIYLERGYGRPVPDRRFVISESLHDVRGAVVLSAITTSIGFGSMYLNRVPDLKTMGLFLVVGLVTTSIAVMTVIPAVFALFPFDVPEQKPHRRVQAVIDWFGRLASSRPRRMLVLSAALFAGGVYGVLQLDTNTDAMHYFKESAEIRKAEDFVRARMAGTTYLQAVVFGDNVDDFKEPENLRKLQAVQAFAETLPHVTKTVSHADHVRLLNQALIGGGPDAYQIPGSRAAVEQYLLLHNRPDDFRLWIDSDYRNASVMIRMDTMSSAVQRENEKKLEAFMASQFPGYRVNLVGTNLLSHRAFDEMAESMLKSLGVATLLIWLVMSIGLRSFKLGSLSMIPNFAPSLIVYSLLPIIGQPLDPPTAVTGAIALGILADDTIHGFKTWQAHRRAPGSDAASAVRGMLSQVGKPMVLSSVIVAAGFSIMLVSRYGTLVLTGVMMALVTSSALVWELVCTPSMLRLLRKPVAPQLTPRELALIESHQKVRATESKPSLASYSEAELDRMPVADLFAVAGKPALRPGGYDGTRRLLVELAIAPHARVLVGSTATAIALASQHKNLRITAIETGVFPQVGAGLDNVQIVRSTELSKLPFEDNTFDAIVLESTASHHDAPSLLAETLRVLAPGGALGLHDWCWMEPASAELEAATSVIACGCNAGDVKFYSKEGWSQQLKARGFEVDFVEHYPSRYLSLTGFRDDDGAPRALAVAARVLARPEARRRVVRIKRFLRRHEVNFGYTVAVARKPAAP